VQTVQLYDVDSRRWRPPFQRFPDALVHEVSGLAMAGPHLTLAAAGREVLLWRGDRLMRRFQGAGAAASSRRG
jgi:hypothetical protein